MKAYVTEKNSESEVSLVSGDYEIEISEDGDSYMIEYWWNRSPVYLLNVQLKTYRTKEEADKIAQKLNESENTHWYIYVVEKVKL